MADAVTRTPLGTTTVHPRVLHTVAVAAALTVPGCIRHSSGLGRLTGRPFPQVEVRSLSTAVDAQVHVATEWPAPVADIAARVRRAVTEHLAAVTGIPVVRVDVHVGAVVPSGRRPDEVSVPMPVPGASAVPTPRSPGPVTPAVVVSPKAPAARPVRRPRRPEPRTPWSPSVPATDRSGGRS